MTILHDFAGMRKNAADTDLSEILPEEIEEKVKENAEISMGTEISKTDIDNIIFLCDQVQAHCHVLHDMLAAMLQWYLLHIMQ